MKKVLLFALAIIVAAGVYSQQGNKLNSQKRKMVYEPENSVKNNQGSAIEQSELDFKTVKDGEVEKVVIGLSGNVFGSLNSLSGPISYNRDLDLLTYVFRADPATYPSALASGTIMASYSTDHGANWTEPCLIVNTEAGAGNYNNRFPNGTIYNPPGNTSVDDAYFIVAGPSHDGAASILWTWIYFGSSNMNCENNYNEFFTTDPENDMGSYMGGIGLTAYNEVAHAFQMKCVELTPGFFASTDIKITDMIGTWEGDHFEFEEGETIDFTEILTAKLSDGELTWRGGYTGGDNCIGLEWSKDLQTGYMWLIGQSQEIMMGAQPIVFKTIDGGSNWDEIEINFEDYEEFFEEWMYPATEGVTTPRFNETVAAVDANGNLQILAVCAGSSTLHVDSVASWGYGGPCIYNVEITDAGVNNVIWVDSIWSDVVDDADACAYAGGSTQPQGWNHRLGIAKSPDETKIFFTWTNDLLDENGDNCAPNIFGSWRNINDDELYLEDRLSFTEGTDFDGLNFFAYTADYVFHESVNDSFFWYVPYTQTLTPVEYLTNSDLDPVTHHFVKGIKFFDHNPGTGINEVSTGNDFLVSQNTPNPSNGITTIEFLLGEKESVSVKLMNIVGQTVYEKDLGIYRDGTNITQLDVSDFEPGIYFYTLQAGINKVTRKMIVN